jgi:trimethylamine:corrinoid methyltransferase-like protein
MHARGFVADFKAVDVLTEGQVEQIHRGALEVLNKTEVQVESRGGA